MESIQLTAIKRQVAFLDSIGAIFDIHFDGQEFISKLRPESLRTRAKNLPWAQTDITDRISAMKIGQEINVETPEFTTVARLLCYCSATCCTKFGAGSCVTATAADGKSVNVLRVY
jgi:hypothetical protein